MHGDREREGGGSGSDIRRCLMDSSNLFRMINSTSKAGSRERYNPRKDERNNVAGRRFFGTRRRSILYLYHSASFGRALGRHINIFGQSVVNRPFPRTYYSNSLPFFFHPSYKMFFFLIDNRMESAVAFRKFSSYCNSRYINNTLRAE